MALKRPGENINLKTEQGKVKNEELPRRTQGNRHKEECTPIDRGKRVTGVNTGGTVQNYQ